MAQREVDQGLVDGIREEARRADSSARTRWGRYQRRLGLRQMFSEQNRLLIQSVGSAHRVLEVGCGIGNFLVDAIEAPNIAYLVGLEVSIENARIANDVARGEAHIILAPAERLPFPDACFDAVVARGVVHHLSDPEAAFVELYRVLRPGGRLVVLEGNPASWYRRFVLGLADAVGLPHEDTQYRHLKPDEITRMLAPFSATRAVPVNGLFAPCAYIGVGGPRFWRLASAAKRALVRLWPSGFDWWLLWTAVR